MTVFEIDEDHVKPWIESIDADAKERGRIQQMNDRFRNL
jgi:hypothetical protein